MRFRKGSGISSIVFVTLIAAGAVMFNGVSTGHETPAEFLYLSAAALLLVAAPIYLVQAGLAFTSPMTTGVVLSLGPLFVFAAQALAGNTPASPYVLSAIALYAIFALLGNLSLARRSVPGAVQAMPLAPRAADAG